MIKYINNFGWIDSDSMDEEATVLEFWRSSWLACSFSMTWSWLSIFSVGSAWSTLFFEFLQIHSSKQRKDRENTNLQLEYEIRYIFYIPGSVHKRHPLFQVVEGSSTWTNSGFWILADVLPLLQIYLSSFASSMLNVTVTNTGITEIMIIELIIQWMSFSWIFSNHQRKIFHSYDYSFFSFFFIQTILLSSINHHILSITIYILKIYYIYKNEQQSNPNSQSLSPIVLPISTTLHYLISLLHTLSNNKTKTFKYKKYIELKENHVKREHSN